jgi:hypothetical protein
VTVTRGADQAFAITPDTGYHVDDVLVDGSSVGAVASYTFTNVQANHTITALFAINTYTISASAGSGGTIAPSGAVSVLYGADKAFTIAPDTGFVIADVLVDGTSVGPVTNYTFTNVQADHTIEASFATAPNHPPVISDLLATPDVIPAGTGSSTVTFTLTDPDGDPIMWSAVLGGSTSTGDLGSLNTASGTVSSGTGVTLTYSANKAGTGTVTVTIQAHDGKGGNATPQTVTLTLF